VIPDHALAERSTLAAMTLRQPGHNDVGRLDGGIKAGIATGKPIAKP